MQGMRLFSVAAAMLVGLAVSAQTPPKTPDSPANPPKDARAAENPPKDARPVDNRLKDAQVGEWLTYVVRTESMGRPTELKATQTVVAKDAMAVTLRTTGELGTQEQKIALNQPYEPLKPAGETDAVITRLAEGDETITVGGKAYPCHWVKAKVWSSRPTIADCRTTVWTCATVPVTGVVKLESESTLPSSGKNLVSKLTMELTGSGK